MMIASSQASPRRNQIPFGKNRRVMFCRKSNDFFSEYYNIFSGFRECNKTSILDSSFLMKLKYICTYAVRTELLKKTEE